MQFNKSPETFIVRELLFPELDEAKGKYNYYLMQKKEIPSDKAVKLIEDASDARVYFSGMKDANATTIQWICSEKELIEPKEKNIKLKPKGKGIKLKSKEKNAIKSKEKNIKLKFMGKSNRRIFVGMHSGNQFNILLEKINEKEKKFLSKELKKIEFPNYFDEQRLNEATLAIGKALAEKNWEKAAKLALTAGTEFESEKSKKIKELIKKNWGRWNKLSQSGEIPESKKKIFKLLELEKEKGFQDAVALLQPKLISISCRAIQAFEFNEQLKNEIMKQNRKEQKFIEIPCEKNSLKKNAEEKNQNEFKKNSLKKNSEENFPIEFKKNALKRKIEISAIFPSKTILERSTFFRAEDASIIPEGKDSAWLSFKLRKGSYATILIKCILEKIKK